MWIDWVILTLKLCQFESRIYLHLFSWSALILIYVASLLILSYPPGPPTFLFDLDLKTFSDFNQFHEAIPYFENHISSGKAANEKKKILFSKQVSLILELFTPHYS